MRIFINALSARLGGGQTYLLNILKHVPKNKKLKIFLLVQPNFEIFDLPSNVVKLEKRFLQNPMLRAIWEETGLISLLKKLKIDLFFSPGGLLPKRLPSNIFSVVTFQNMLPFDLLQRKKYPYGYRRIRDYLLEHELSSSMCRANKIIFISEFAKNFIELNVPKIVGKSTLIPHGVHPAFKHNINKLLPWPSYIPKKDYFLYVSFIDYYKAQIEVVSGFNIFCKKGGHGNLIFVGSEYSPYADLVRQKISELNLSKRVIMLGNVKHFELPALYQNARINIFASFVENCPNILLEIMSSGRPALVSNRNPMREFAADTVEYFDPAKPKDFAMHLARLTSNKKKQRYLARAALKRSNIYSWKKAANLTWACLIDSVKNTSLKSLDART